MLLLVFEHAKFTMFGCFGHLNFNLLHKQYTISTTNSHRTMEMIRLNNDNKISCRFCVFGLKCYLAVTINYIFKYDALLMKKDF